MSIRCPEFCTIFESLTSHKPLPWQQDLYQRFTSDDKQNIPHIADLPTGLGKTSVITVWLIARAHGAPLPRRLVYVVNRRTVVDQTTHEAEKLRAAVKEGKLPGVNQLVISTLRGQFADNGEWYADPSSPAVICGTVDMIGSRLLFEGYRIGFKSRPLHAGFLGQDAMLVHDEAHLEPAFQKLVETIQKEQARERERRGELPWPGLRVMALSATARSSADKGEGTLGLSESDYEHPIVTQRVNASKTLQLHPRDDEKKQLAADVVERALQHKGSGNAILVFLRSVEEAMATLTALEKNLPGQVAPLTGTMRGYERNELVRSNPVFARFMPPGDRSEGLKPAEGTVYLVCTSAGEVGVNLSADRMVCDLSTFDSMAQRLGRVNRFGEPQDHVAQVDVVHPGSFDEKDPLTPARKATLTLLQRLNGDASPKALGDLPAAERLAAFAPEPTILPATDILFDAWAMTTIKGKMPGRPPIAPYLHGVAEWEPKRTSVAWREEVERITDELIEREGDDFPQELLADYPLKPHELLSDRTDRIYSVLQALLAEPNKKVTGEKRKAALERVRRNAEARLWLIDENGSVTVTTLGEMLNDDKKQVIDRLEDGTVLLPPSVGGLSSGILAADSELADDVADRWMDENDNSRRGRVWDDAPPPTYDNKGSTKPMALIRTIDTAPLADETASSDEDSDATLSRKRFWHWYARPRDAEDATRASAKPIKWDHHTRDVVNRTIEIVEALNLPDDLKRAVILAAELHDLGKKRELWQRAIGNPCPDVWFAKAGKPGAVVSEDSDRRRWRRGFRHDYRHEFGSLLDVLDADQEYRARLDGFGDEMCDVVLHLIAAHHGYARPHFPTEATADPDHAHSVADEAAVEVMRRYARLQRRYGRWGLAYLESLLRAADWAASAQPSPAPAAHEVKA